MINSYRHENPDVNPLKLVGSLELLERQRVGVDRVLSSVKQPKDSSICTANRSCTVIVSLQAHPSNISSLLTPLSEMRKSAITSTRASSMLIVKMLHRPTCWSPKK
jgi:hypothetical protein